MAVEFLTFDASPYWDATRVLVCLMGLYLLVRMIFILHSDQVDAFQKWCFAGLTAFVIMVCLQALVAWGQDVPIFRPILGWTGMIAAAVALHRRHQTF